VFKNKKIAYDTQRMELQGLTKQALILRLNNERNLNVDEIAVALDMTPAAVQGHIDKAIKTLRDEVIVDTGTYIARKLTLLDRLVEAVLPRALGEYTEIVIDPETGEEKIIEHNIVDLKAHQQALRTIKVQLDAAMQLTATPQAQVIGQQNNNLTFELTIPENSSLAKIARDHMFSGDIPRPNAEESGIPLRISQGEVAEIVNQLEGLDFPNRRYTTPKVIENGSNSEPDNN
jgi:hypothetical protein